MLLCNHTRRFPRFQGKVYAAGFGPAPGGLKVRCISLCATRTYCFGSRFRETGQTGFGPVSPNFQSGAPPFVLPPAVFLSRAGGNKKAHALFSLRMRFSFRKRTGFFLCSVHTKRGPVLPGPLGYALSAHRKTQLHRSRDTEKAGSTCAVFYKTPPFRFHCLCRTCA